MKIIICIVGNYLPHTIDFKVFKENILYLKKIFNNYDYEMVFFTWNLEDINLIKNIKTNINMIMYDKLDPLTILNKISNFKNRNKTKFYNYLINKGYSPGGSPMNVYCMYYLRKIAMNYINNNYPDSYTFLIRPDMHIEFNDINKWINKNTYNTILYRCWRLYNNNHDGYGRPHNPISEQISVGDTNLLYKFYDMNDNEIYKLFEISHNLEDSIYNRLNKLKIKYIRHNIPTVDNMWLFSTDNH